MIQLHTEQRYVIETAEELGIYAELVGHSVPTDNCYEKASVLGWDFRRVIKALYFSKNGHTVGVVTPETGCRIDLRKVLEVLGVSKRDALSYKLDDPPIGMERGTCTPFPCESVGELYVDNFLIADCPWLEDTLVDVSVGGTGEEAHKTSMHLPYQGIYLILSRVFNGKVFSFG